MNIQALQQNKLNNNSFSGNYQRISKGVANKFASMNEMGEGISIACDFLGKAVVVPMVIMAASDEPKETKQYSALKNPVAALIQLAFEVPILAFGSKGIEKLADKGFFDKDSSSFSYNTQTAKQSFVDVFEKEKSVLVGADKFLETLNKKGYCKKTVEQFKETMQNADSTIKENVESAFKSYEKVYKNTFHLKNRICFGAALILTPLLCNLEDKLHPKIMDLIAKNKNPDTHNNVFRRNIPDMVDFASLTKRRQK